MKNVVLNPTKTRVSSVSWIPEDSLGEKIKICISRTDFPPNSSSVAWGGHWDSALKKKNPSMWFLDHSTSEVFRRNLSKQSSYIIRISCWILWWYSSECQNNYLVKSLKLLIRAVKIFAKLIGQFSLKGDPTVWLGTILKCFFELIMLQNSVIVCFWTSFSDTTQSSSFGGLRSRDYTWVTFRFCSLHIGVN